MSVETPTPEPVMRVTSYDHVSSSLIALVSGLGLTIFVLTAAWYSIEPLPPRVPVALEIVDSQAAGVEDGSPDETLKLEGPGPEDELASVASDDDSPEPEIAESLDNVMDVADEATVQADRQYEFQTRERDSGVRGSANGTGRRALGIGHGKAGIPREQRWYVSYNDRETLEEYGKQLDFFKVELGLLTSDGKLIYLSKLSQAKPVSRTSTTGKNEARLYMTWQGGARRKADVQLFQKAGIDPGPSVMLQFYPAEIEKMLARLELDFRKRPLSEIRRTSFATRPTPDAKGYEFYVTNQSYFRSVK